MNKTVNINLGGMFFHIDEDAYQKLSRYFDAIKSSLSNSSGKDEIIKDIEMRVCELLTEKQINPNQVVSVKDVDEVIAVMGQPEDYIIEDDSSSQQNFNQESYSSTSKSRKLYRDTDGGMIGGVLAGLGHYFGIDKVWLRVIVLLLVFAFGTGILAYLILWVVMPEARTTTEKLEMHGEPVNISNIEKKVREEFDNVSDKFKNVDYDKYGNQFKSGANKIGSTFSDILMTVFNVFAKFMGVILIISGIALIVVFLIGVLTLGSTHFNDFPFHQFIETGNFTDYPIWVFGLAFFLAVAIPAFFLILLGFKLVSPNLKSIGNIAKYSLLALWIIAIALLISIGINQASAFANDGRVVKKQNIALQSIDTLKIKFIHNDYYAKNVNDRREFRITQDSLGNDVIYSNEVRFRIESTDSKIAYVQIEKEAKGKSLSEAKKRANQIRYKYQLIGNQLIFDNYLLTDISNKFRDQEIEITLFLPVGTVFQVDKSAKNYDRSNDDFFDLNESSDRYTYKVLNSKVQCLDCPAGDYNNDYEDEDTDVDVDGEVDIRLNEGGNNSISINKNGITINNDTIVKSTTTKHELRINKDGIIIKTK